MDPSSVITQVTPDNNDASHLFTVQKGNGVPQKGKSHTQQNYKNQSMNLYMSKIEFILILSVAF